MGQRFQESPDSVSPPTPTMHQPSILIKNPLIVIIHNIPPPSILKYNHISCDEYHYPFYAKNIPSETHSPRRHLPKDTTPGPKSRDPHPQDKLSNGGNRSPKSQTDLSLSVSMTKRRPRADPCLQRQEKLDIIHISTSQTS
jgi:hypothetical protein